MNPKRKLHGKVPYVRFGSVKLPVYLTEDHEQHGYYDSWPEQAIHVARQEESSEIRTILHESIHAAADLYGIELSEAKVRVLENAIGQLICQNPKLVQLLQKYGR
jgi:hypothetical protein